MGKRKAKILRPNFIKHKGRKVRINRLDMKPTYLRYHSRKSEWSRLIKDLVDTKLHPQAIREIVYAAARRTEELDRMCEA